MSRELHAQNPTGRFTDRAGAYAVSRPSYPAAAIDAVLDGLPSGLVAADVGAGTGISSRLLAERGVRVFAIEPNKAMRDAGGTHEGIEWRDATAESTGLADQSVHLVLAAQAFHWFEAEKALREFHRILRAGGRLAVVWNERDLTDPFTARYSGAVGAASGRAPEQKWHLRPEELYFSKLFTAAWEQTFTNEQWTDADGLVGRAFSASYTPAGGESAARLADELRALHAQFRDARGFVRLVYRTILYLSSAVPSP